jgi:hypothetical protein
VLTARSLTTFSLSIQIVEKGNANAVRSSTAFFNRLQDEVKNHIKVKASGGNPGRQKGVKSAKKLKL